MCSAPNVYMFVYILIGTHMVPLNCNVKSFLSFRAAQMSSEASYLYLFTELFREDFSQNKSRRNSVYNIQLSTCHVTMDYEVREVYM